jgi:hypothetical protein
MLEDCRERCNFLVGDEVEVTIREHKATKKRVGSR